MVLATERKVFEIKFKYMNLSTILILVGLSFNIVASIIMLYPFLNTRKNIDDDFIVDINIKNGDFTQKKHLKDKKLGTIAYIFFAIGFILQFFGTLI